MSKWSTASKLGPNIDGTNIIKFILNNSPQYATVGYNEKDTDCKCNLP
jgi:hypothetical protein